MDTAEYASRRIVGIVFVVLSFLTLVFYGLWVASGVVAEKANRVMELLISAATAPQLVIGKIGGIGLAGLTQVRSCSRPPSWPCSSRDALGTALLGPDETAAPALAGLSPGLLLAFLVYFTLGFALYAALYAGAGSLISRAGGPPDHRPAAVDPRDHGLLPGRARAVRRRGTAHPVRVLRAAVEPVRDDGAALGRLGGAMGARAVARPPDRDGPARDLALDPRLPRGRAAVRPAAHGADLRPGGPRHSRAGCRGRHPRRR